jgi:hypothetical protein
MVDAKSDFRQMNMPITNLWYTPLPQGLTSLFKNFPESAHTILEILYRVRPFQFSYHA